MSPSILLLRTETENCIERYYDQFLFSRTWESMAQRKLVVVDNTDI